jgi:hypothetical protein
MAGRRSSSYTCPSAHEESQSHVCRERPMKHSTRSKSAGEHSQHSTPSTSQTNRFVLSSPSMHNIRTFQLSDFHYVLDSVNGTPPGQRLQQSSHSTKGLSACDCTVLRNAIRFSAQPWAFWVTKIWVTKNSSSNCTYYLFCLDRKQYIHHDDDDTWQGVHIFAGCSSMFEKSMPKSGGWLTGSRKSDAALFRYSIGWQEQCREHGVTVQTGTLVRPVFVA